MGGILTDPKYHDYLALVKGFRNGAVYGCKVRFPHAVVMTYLFRHDLSHREKWRWILKATYQHSKNLALFNILYKLMLLLQRKVRGYEKSQDSFVAGFLGGWIVFGEDTLINQQIVLYLTSRILVGFAKTSVKQKWVPEPTFKVFPVFAAAVWASVMWLFRHEKDTLPGGLQASMEYLYNDSESWKTLKTLLWHNKN